MKIKSPQKYDQVNTSTISTFCERIVEWAQTNETFKRCDYFRQQYIIEFYLAPQISALLPNTAPLLRFTLSGTIIHPMIAYYNELQKKGILSEIYEKNLPLLEFVKSEYLSLSSRETQLKVISTIAEGFKQAMMGPFLTYLGISILPKAYGALINAVLISIVKSIISYLFFQNTNIQVPLILMLITGSLRGAIYYEASVFFDFLRFESGDVFYLSMWVRQLFEPILKTLEKLNITELSKQILQAIHQRLTYIALYIFLFIKNKLEINHRILAQLSFQIVLVLLANSLSF